MRIETPVTVINVGHAGQHGFYCQCRIGEISTQRQTPHAVYRATFCAVSRLIICPTTALGTGALIPFS